MMSEKKETARNASAPTEAGQSNKNSSICSINNNVAKCNNLKTKQVSNKLNTVTMTDLFDTYFPSRPPIIDGLLYPGTYIFCGPPKCGKSFFMLQMGYHISKGLPLWDLPVRQGTVLYLALEDEYTRLQKRLSRMFDIEGSDHFYLAIKSKNLNDGLDTQIKDFIQAHQDTALIIIDTLQKIRNNDEEAYSYCEDYDVISKLKEISDQNEICLLIVHHTRKQKSKDNFDMISGTQGLSGAADGAFVLKKSNRLVQKVTLDVTGRDQPDQCLHFSKDPKTLQWVLDEIESESWEEPPNPLLEQIAKRINSENPDWSGTPTELATFLNTDMKPNALSRKLNPNTDRLLKEYNIQYNNKRTHDNRIISFHYEMPIKEQCDDIIQNDPGV